MEFTQNKAIFLQIADNMCERILRKEFRYNERVSSVREMAVLLQVNPNTVLRAYNLLQSHGILVNKRGVGYHAAAHAVAMATEYRRKAFMEFELPQVFQTAGLLHIDFDELRKEYHQYHLKR